MKESLVYLDGRLTIERPDLHCPVIDLSGKDEAIEKMRLEYLVFLEQRIRFRNQASLIVAMLTILVALIGILFSLIQPS